MRIAVAGTGYVGLSLAVLLSRNNDVVAVDVVPEKVDKLNKWISPIRDEYIEKFFAEHEQLGLKLRSTMDGAEAYRDADYVIIATPTNYDPEKNVVRIPTWRQDVHRTCDLAEEVARFYGYDNIPFFSRIPQGIKGAV